MAQDDFKEGKVKFYNTSKGYGFISFGSNNTEEVFVHATGLTDGTKIKQDDDVRFKVTEGKKGLNAVEVELI